MRSLMPNTPLALTRIPAIALFLALGAALACAAANAAEVYKYTDANGKVQYTDRAPSNATAVKVPTQPPAQAPKPTANAARPGANSANPQLPVSPDQAKQVQRDVATARAEQCKQAKDNYEKAVRAQRIYRTNEKGEKTFISPAEADTARLQMKADMDGFCGG